MLEMGLARIYPYSKFEVSSFTRSKDTAHVPLNALMREGVSPNSRVDLRRFLPDPTKFGVAIVEWSVLNANILDFRYVFTLSNYGANCMRHGMKMVQIFLFTGNLDEIGIAKVLLNTKPRRVGKFWRCRFFATSEKVWREKKRKITEFNLRQGQ